MTIQRMDNVGIVVEDIDAAIEFFTELGLSLEGRAPIAGDWADGVTGLSDMRVEIAMMRTPDGHGRLELSRFLAPPPSADHRHAPVNAVVPPLLHPRTRGHLDRAGPGARAGDASLGSRSPRTAGRTGPTESRSINGTRPGARR